MTSFYCKIDDEDQNLVVSLRLQTMNISTLFIWKRGMDALYLVEAATSIVTTLQLMLITRRRTSGKSEWLDQKQWKKDWNDLKRYLKDISECRGLLSIASVLWQSVIQRIRGRALPRLLRENRYHSTSQSNLGPRQLSYCVHADLSDDLFDVSETKADRYLQYFCRSIKDAICAVYIPKSTVADITRIETEFRATGFLGYICCLYYTGRAWKNCPKAPQRR